MVEKKKDLNQYFIKHMYDDYYINLSGVFVGNGVKWFGIMNALNFYLNYGCHGDVMFLCGIWVNSIAIIGTILSTKIAEGDIDYKKVFEYKRVKEICDNYKK